MGGREPVGLGGGGLSVNAKAKGLDCARVRRGAVVCRGLRSPCGLPGLSVAGAVVPARRRAAPRCAVCPLRGDRASVG